LLEPPSLSSVVGKIDVRRRVGHDRPQLDRVITPFEISGARWTGTIVLPGTTASVA
jgi:hypothetical protein